jgi:hypothetical protein
MTFAAFMRGYRRGRIRDLEIENEHLRALVDERFKDIRLVSANAGPHGFEFALRSGVGGLLAEWMLQAIQSVGAKNYVEIEAFHPEAGKLSFTLMRMGGESPGARAARYERIIKAYVEPLPLAQWHEDHGPQLWWKFPVSKPPYCGTPLNRDWPGYHTHFTRIPVPKIPIFDSGKKDCREA